MRDPKRIPKVLKEIERLWKKVPDWRLGQLLGNFLCWYNRDPFFPEDDEFVAELKRYFKEGLK